MNACGEQGKIKLTAPGKQGQVTSSRHSIHAFFICCAVLLCFTQLTEHHKSTKVGESLRYTDMC